MEKRMAKLNDMLAKKMNKKQLGGLDDPIDKFLWWAIIAAAGAIIFSFFLWPVSVILWIGSLVLLVLWIIKKIRIVDFSLITPKACSATDQAFLRMVGVSSDHRVRRPRQPPPHF